MLSFDCGLRHHGRQIEALHHRGRVHRTAEVGEGEGRDVDLAQIEHALGGEGGKLHWRAGGILLQFLPKYY